MFLNVIFNINKIIEVVFKVFCILSNLVLGWCLGIKNCFMFSCVIKNSIDVRSIEMNSNGWLFWSVE